MTTLLSIAIAMLAGLMMSRVAKKFGLPAVTAYLIAGILIGPYCMGQSEYHFLDCNVTTYKCSSCGRTYEIEYSMDSTGIDYSNIIDIRKNDEDSLFIGGDR